MTRCFWLSFSDDGGFLGGCRVEVTEADMHDARAIVRQRFGERPEQAYWIAAASRKAHALGCNPGCEMLSIDITDATEADRAKFTIGRLYSKADIENAGPAVKVMTHD